MKVIDLKEIVGQGKKPLIQFEKGIYNHIEDSVDSKMIGKIIATTGEYLDENCLTLHVDLNGHEAHNKSVAKRDWYDANSKPILTWFDSGMYPKNGIVELVLDKDLDTEKVFKFIEENNLLQEFISTQEQSGYVEWLESMVVSLRSQNIKKQDTAPSAQLSEKKLTIVTGDLNKDGYGSDIRLFLVTDNIELVKKESLKQHKKGITADVIEVELNKPCKEYLGGYIE